MRHRLLERQSAFPLEPHVEYQTAGAAGFAEIEEFPDAAKCFDAISDRLQQVAQRETDGLFIVDDEDCRATDSAGTGRNMPVGSHGKSLGRRGRGLRYPCVRVARAWWPVRPRGALVRHGDLYGSGEIYKCSFAHSEERWREHVADAARGLHAVTAEPSLRRRRRGAFMSMRLRRARRVSPARPRSPR